MSNPTVWNFLPAPTDLEQREGEAFAAEFLARGYVAHTPSSTCGLPDGVVVALYQTLARERSAESPLRGQRDSRWMLDADFCFVNVRATGMNGQFGTLLSAARFLPTLRASAIHLAPFTDYDFETIYAPRRLRTISPTIVAPGPLTPEDQLRAFVQAAHMLGKVVGFDAEPHVAQFSALVIERPELFRWLRLADDKQALAGGFDTDAMLASEVQARIIADVQALAGAALRGAGLTTLEETASDDAATRERKRETYFDLIRRLIDAGYWAIPSQSWAAQGVPAFRGYADGNYPLFDYRSPDGLDLSHTAYHTVTPFAFYGGMRANQPPHDAERNQAAWDAFAGLFAYWRDGFDFDFVRYDSVDHILDSCAGDDSPLSDRPTPAVLRYATEQAKTGQRPYIGNLAERMGTEVEPYAAIGSDLMLGDDMLSPVGAPLLERSFALYDRLAALNANERHFGVTFAVDTHDTGNPAFGGRPLIQAAGADEMRRRHFLSRFLDVGPAPRPKYEIIGAQDLSYGLYEANVRNVNLTWADDADYNRGYHFLEDAYAAHRDRLKRGQLVRRFVDSDYGWWWFEAADGWLLAFISYGVPPLPLSIALPDGVSTRHGVVIDFAALRETAFTLTGPEVMVFDPAPKLWVFPPD